MSKTLRKRAVVSDEERRLEERMFLDYREENSKDLEREGRSGW